MNWPQATQSNAYWSKIARRVAITLLTVILVGALVRSARDVQMFVGVDLVPKIGGAQRFFAHVSPYTEWTSQQTGFLPDANAVLPFSRCSYPPTMLLFYRIGAWFDYRLVRYAWAALEWAALLASIALMVVASAKASERWASAFVGIVFFASSYFFRLHVERGQYYVFVTLFWALAWACARRRGLNSYTTGFFLGMAAAIRPTSLPALLALAIFGFWRALGASFFAFAAMITVTLVVGGVSMWTDFVGLARYVGQCTVNVPSGQRPPPLGATLAGYDAVALLPAKTANTSVLQQLMTAAHLLHLKPDEQLLPLLAQGIVAVVMLLAFAWIIRVRKSESDRRIMLWSLVVALVCDFASPVRHGYADVLYFVPIAVAMPDLLTSFGRAGIAGWSGPLVLSGLCWSLVTDIGLVSTLARTVCVMTALAILMLQDRGDVLSSGSVAQVKTDASGPKPVEQGSDVAGGPIRPGESTREVANPPVA